MYARDSLTFGAPEELTRGYHLVREDSVQLPPLHLNHEERQIMRKLLLSTAAAIMLAGPALAKTTSVSANLTVTKTVPKPGASSTIINLGTVDFIAFGNRVDVYVPSVNTIATVCTVTVPLAIITDMVFAQPSFLTVQGGGPFAVTLDYSVCPPTIFPAVPL
jgi:hypothetical protein